MGGREEDALFARQEKVKEQEKNLGLESFKK